MLNIIKHYNDMDSKKPENQLQIELKEDDDEDDKLWSSARDESLLVLLRILILSMKDENVDFSWW